MIASVLISMLHLHNIHCRTDPTLLGSTIRLLACFVAPANSCCPLNFPTSTWPSPCQSRPDGRMRTLMATTHCSSWRPIGGSHALYVPRTSGVRRMHMHLCLVLKFCRVQVHSPGEKIGGTFVITYRRGTHAYKIKIKPGSDFTFAQLTPAHPRTN